MYDSLVEAAAPEGGGRFLEHPERSQHGQAHVLGKHLRAAAMVPPLPGTFPAPRKLANYEATASQSAGPSGMLSCPVRGRGAFPLCTRKGSGMYAETGLIHPWMALSPSNQPWGSGIMVYAPPFPALFSINIPVQTLVK